MLSINAFEGDYRFLSNFFPSVVRYEGDTYPTVEHAYQAAKTLDANTRQLLQQPSVSAAHAKRIGKTVHMRKDWDNIKVGVMRNLLMDKFSHPSLQEKLLATDDLELIEGNWWGDTFWGVCKGVGKNILGKLLMEVRDHYKQLRK